MTNTITINGVYEKQTFWQWLTRRPKVLRKLSPSEARAIMDYRFLSGQQWTDVTHHGVKILQIDKLPNLVEFDDN